MRMRRKNKKNATGSRLQVQNSGMIQKLQLATATSNLLENPLTGKLLIPKL
jgi:hypothetical protein